MSKLGLTPEQKKVVITFWDAVTVEDPREIAFLPTSWSETHAADTGFTNLSDFMNKFFRKTDCPATSVICSTLGGSTNKWDRQDKNKGVIYYQLAASSSEAPVHFNHVAENKAGKGQGISKAWYLRRRFVNPEDSAEVQTMRTELGKLPAGVFKHGINADRILEALKGIKIYFCARPSSSSSSSSSSGQAAAEDATSTQASSDQAAAVVTIPFEPDNTDFAQLTEAAMEAIDEDEELSEALSLLPGFHAEVRTGIAQRNDGRHPV